MLQMHGYMYDIIMYKTGSMDNMGIFTSWNGGIYAFSWSWCEWIPETFKGGKLMYTQDCDFPLM